MIYVTVGTQKFQFDRLLKYVDIAIEKGDIKEEVFAQVGHSTYKPKNYKYSKFISKSDCIDVVDKSNIIITHGGSGSIIESLQKCKKVLAIPRNCEFEEHVDNHQFELVNKLAKEKILLSANSEQEFLEKIREIKLFKPKEISKILDNCSRVQNIIDEFLK